MTGIRKDTIFYEQSGGGVTFSGGEPMMQMDFLYAVLRACKIDGYRRRWIRAVMPRQRISSG